MVKRQLFLLWYQLGYFLLTPNFCCWTPPKPWFVISGTFSRQNVWLSSWAWPLWCTRACHLWSSSAVVDGGWCWDSRLRFFCRFCCVVFSNLGRSWYVLYDYGFDDQLYSMITTHVQPPSRRLGDSLFKALPFWPGHLDHVDESLDHKGRLHGSPNIMGIQPFQTWPRKDGDSAHSGSGGLGRNHMIFKKTP